MNRDIIPLFTSHYSIGRSTLTLEKADEIKNEKPISIYSIAKEFKLEDIYLVENNFSGFIEAYKNAKDSKVQLKFGLRIIICSDINDKSDTSKSTESKVIIWMKNSDGYKDLIKIYSKAATDGFYYLPRLDWKLLNEMWSNNLLLSIPPYSSFLHNNLLKRYECVPDLGKLNPNILFAKMSLPFDSLIYEASKTFAENNKLDFQEVHPIRFYSSKQFDSYLTFRCINKRSTLSMPQIDNFASKDFCWETYNNR